MHLRRASLLALLGTLACSSTETAPAPKAGEAAAPSASAQEEPTGDPDWFKQAMARELPPGDQKVTIQGADFSAEVEGTGGLKITPMDAHTYVKWGIGTDVEIECVMYPEALDLAASLVSIAHELWNVAEGILGKLEREAVLHVDAGAWGGVPFLRLDYAYRTVYQGEPRAGVLKQLITRRDGRSIYCRHNEPGYSQAFQRIAGEFMQNAQLTGGEPVETLYRSISVLSLNGQPLGVSEYRITPRPKEEGGYRIVESESSFTLHGPNGVAPHDSYSIEFTNSDGALQQAVEVAGHGKEMDKNLRLAAAPEGKWRVSGTFQGEALETELAVQNIPSGIEYYRRKRDFLATPEAGQSWSIASWVPNVNPNALTTSTVTILELKEHTIAAETATGELKMQSELDLDGDIRTLEIKMGANTLHIERVHKEGEYP